MEAFFFKFNFAILIFLEVLFHREVNSSRLFFSFFLIPPIFFSTSRLKAELSNLLFLTLPGLGCRDVQHVVGYGPR